MSAHASDLATQRRLTRYREAKQWLEADESLWALTINPIGFRLYNQEPGRNAGDELLERYGNSILATLHPEETGADLGPDLFVVLSGPHEAFRARRDELLMKCCAALPGFQFWTLTERAKCPGSEGRHWEPCGHPYFNAVDAVRVEHGAFRQSGTFCG